MKNEHRVTTEPGALPDDETNNPSGTVDEGAAPCQPSEPLIEQSPGQPLNNEAAPENEINDAPGALSEASEPPVDQHPGPPLEDEPAPGEANDAPGALGEAPEPPTDQCPAQRSENAAKPEDHSPDTFAAVNEGSDSYSQSAPVMQPPPDGLAPGAPSENVDQQQKVCRFQTVKISDIKIRKPPRKADLSRLTDSMANLGIVEPVTLTTDLTLWAGRLRLETAKVLGFTEAPAIIHDWSELEAELASIDTNVCRENLTELEQAEQIARREELYYTLHPSACKHGGDRKGENQADAVSFCTDTEASTGMSARWVQRNLRIAKICAKARDLLRATPVANCQKDLLEIAELSEPMQGLVAKEIERGASLAEAKATLGLPARTKKEPAGAADWQPAIEMFLTEADRYRRSKGRKPGNWEPTNTEKSSRPQPDGFPSASMSALPDYFPKEALPLANELADYMGSSFRECLVELAPDVAEKVVAGENWWDSEMQLAYKDALILLSVTKAAERRVKQQFEYCRAVNSAVEIYVKRLENGEQPAYVTVRKKPSGSVPNIESEQAVQQFGTDSSVPVGPQLVAPISDDMQKNEEPDDAAAEPMSSESSDISQSEEGKS